MRSMEARSRRKIPWGLLRVFVFALLAVGGATYAVVRALGTPRPSLRSPAPAASEIEVDLE